MVISDYKKYSASREHRRIGVDQRQRILLSGQVVLDAAKHQRAAVAVGAGAHLIGRQPQGAHDAVVQRALGVVGAERAAEGQAQVGDVLSGAFAQRAREVDAEQRRGRKGVGGFLQRLARAGLLGRLAGVQMAGRVVQPQPVEGVLLHQQEAALALDDGCDGDIGFPAGVHGGRLSGIAFLLMQVMPAGGRVTVNFR